MKGSPLATHGAASNERSSRSVPTHVYPYMAGIVGGLLGGVGMTAPALLYGFLSGHGPWYPVNLVAAALLPQMQVMPPPELELFNPLYVATGLALHLTLATGLGLLFALLLPTLPGRPQLWALVIGPVLWLGATLALLPTLNPIMSRLLDWPSFAIANLVYGLIMGLWVAHTPKVRV